MAPESPAVWRFGLSRTEARASSPTCWRRAASEREDGRAVAAWTRRFAVGSPVLAHPQAENSKAYGVDMSSTTVQWMIWALLMFLFTGLTLAARWLDLALALTLAAIFWYGIVPEIRSGRQ